MPSIPVGNSWPTKGGKGFPPYEKDNLDIYMRLSTPAKSFTTSGANKPRWRTNTTSPGASRRSSATENTREVIFDAIARKEAYATTGPRITVRFFGGWDFTSENAQSRLPAEIGYDRGVPTGGDLRTGPAGKAPSFLVAAVKDSYNHCIVGSRPAGFRAPGLGPIWISASVGIRALG